MIPKFRAWDKKVKEMIEDVTSIHFKTEMIATSNLYFYPCKDIELMQSTGLKDKNGVEIFEGDIVKSKEGWISEVYYDKSAVSFRVKLGLLYLSAGTWVSYFDGEVIGNIHEHPGLLEGDCK